MDGMCLYWSQIVLATVNDKLVGVMDAVSLLANQTSRELIAETLEEVQT
jgi:hypothetical protein